jgi:uncharacterized protein (TIGR00369 family)
MVMTAATTDTNNLTPATTTMTRSRTVSWTDPEPSRLRWRGLDGYERLATIKRGELSPAPVVALLGLSLDELERGRTVCSIIADEMHENPMGAMHGGIVATLVDTAMGCAVVSTLPSDANFTTLELSTNFVRAITRTTGRVHAEGRVVHSGGRIVTTEARVYDDAGHLYAHATSTCMILRSAP